MKKALRHISVIIAVTMVMSLVPVTAFGASSPGKPAIKGFLPITSTSLKISWTKASNASGYQLYRATSSKGTYKRVVTTTARSYTNKGLTTGKKYYYKVRAYRKVNGSKKYGKFSSAKSYMASPMSAITMPSAINPDGTMTFKVDTRGNTKEMYIITSMKTTFNDQNIFGFIVPGARDNGGTVDVGNLQSFEFVSAKDLTGGNMLEPVTYSAFEAITVPKGHKVEITMKYMYNSTSPMGFDKESDAFAYYLAYGNYFYDLVWMKSEGVYFTKIA